MRPTDMKQPEGRQFIQRQRETDREARRWGPDADAPTLDPEPYVPSLQRDLQSVQRDQRDVRDGYYRVMANGDLQFFPQSAPGAASVAGETVTEAATPPKLVGGESDG